MLFQVALKGIERGSELVYQTAPTGVYIGHLAVPFLGISLPTGISADTAIDCSGDAVGLGRSQVRLGDDRFGLLPGTGQDLFLVRASVGGQLLAVLRGVGRELVGLALGGVQKAYRLGADKLALRFRIEQIQPGAKAVGLFREPTSLVREPL